MTGVVRSLVPARMDRLPWTTFHTRLVIALGVTWVLDGLEIAIASLIGPVLQRPDTLGFRTADVGTAASIYLIGEVVGALGFGYLADRLGRRKLFLATLGLYLAANAVTALAFDLPSFVACRFLAGSGIGGEYAAVNSAIDELIPARYRGHADLTVNGTYWLGAILGTLCVGVLLAPGRLSANLAWRIALLVGPAIGVAIWGLRRHLPESPRWLLTRGYEAEAERTVAAIERDVAARGYVLPPVDPRQTLALRATRPLGYATLARVLFAAHPSRAFLGAMLMASQSFLYNAIFFTYGLVLTHFHGVDAADVPRYFYPFAIASFLGPLTIGRWFDTLGRRPMIAGTYIGAGVLLAVSGWLFRIGVLGPVTQTLAWSVVFFVGSAAASSAYLTVSEIFPLEVRSQAIALFFAIGQIVGAVGPVVFGMLIGDQAHPDPTRLFAGYAFAAAMMVAGGVAEILFGVGAERASLEDVATPLSVLAAEG